METLIKIPDIENGRFIYVKPSDITYIVTEEHMAKLERRGYEKRDACFTHIFLRDGRTYFAYRRIDYWANLLNYYGFFSPRASHLINSGYVIKTKTVYGLELIIYFRNGKTIRVPMINKNNCDA